MIGYFGTPLNFYLKNWKFFWLIGILFIIIAAIVMVEGRMLGERTILISTLLGVIGLILIVVGRKR